MLEQLNLTDEEKDALQGDREVITALIARLGDTPTPAGPIPKEIGSQPAFIPLDALTSRLISPTNHGDPEKIA